MSNSQTTTSAEPDTEEPDTIEVAALDLLGGHVLVGDCGGRSLVSSARHNTLVQGFVTVETEHGCLLLDDDREITFIVEAD